MAVRIDLIGPKNSFMKSERCFGPKSLGAAQINWTWNLIFEIATSKSRAEGINNFLKRQDRSRTELVDLLAGELLQSLKGISLKTVKLCPIHAQKIIKSAAGNFIELADLSHAKDIEFVDFIVNVLLRALAKHFPDNEVHSGVVTFYAAAIAKELDFSERNMRRIRTAGDLHDIGKIGCPEELLNKVDITIEDKNLIDGHLVIGVYLLEEIKYFRKVAEIVKHHHSHPFFDKEFTPEFMDKDLYILAEILRVADAYDGMTSPRKYKKVDSQVRDFDKRTVKVYSKEEALKELRKEDYYKKAVDALESVLERAEHYILNIKDLFLKEEIKFVWPGVSHLIQKTILPSGEKKEVTFGDLWLLQRAPLLWLISDRKKDFGDVFNFINYVKGQIDAFAQVGGVEGELNGAMKAIKKDYRDYAGVVYEALFRAMDADIKMRSNTFSDIINFLAGQGGDITKMIKGVDTLYPEPEKNEEAFFLWLASRLYGESTESVPIYGERAFIEFAKKMCGGNKG